MYIGSINLHLLESNIDIMYIHLSISDIHLASNRSMIYEQDVSRYYRLYIDTYGHVLHGALCRVQANHPGRLSFW